MYSILGASYIDRAQISRFYLDPSPQFRDVLEWVGSPTSTHPLQAAAAPLTSLSNWLTLTQKILPILSAFASMQVVVSVSVVMVETNRDIDRSRYPCNTPCSCHELVAGIVVPLVMPQSMMTLRNSRPIGISRCWEPSPSLVGYNNIASMYSQTVIRVDGCITERIDK